MDLSKYYEKLPQKIKDSELLLLLCMRISKKIRKIKSKSSEKPNNFANFLFKHSNIQVEGTLRDIQLVYLELLIFIDKICKKYDLEYFLVYGTLIGAVRHEGFIPWDDDCDIVMMRKDYNKFLEILPLEINKHDFLKKEIALTRLIGIDEDYFSDFNSIYDDSLGLYDFFDKTNDAHKLFLQIGFRKPLVKLDVFTYEYIKEEYVDYYNDNLFGHKYYFRKSLTKPNISFDEEYQRTCDKLGFTLKETDFIGEGLDGSDVDDFGVYEADMIFPTKTMTFEGYELKVPNKSHELLKIWYGDNYMDIPSNIEMHNYSEYNLSLFNSKSEMNDKFKEIIQELKNINETF